MVDEIRMVIQWAVATADEENTIAEEKTATAVKVEMTKVALDEATEATDRYSRLAELTRTRGIIPLTAPWFHTMEPSRRMNSSVLRKGVEDRPEEDLAEVCTDEEAEVENLDDRKEKKRQVLALVQGEPKNGIPETQ